LNLQIRKPVGAGLNKLVDGEMSLLRFYIIRLHKGESYDERDERDERDEHLERDEMGLILLSGSCEIEFAGVIKEKIGPREDVFSDPAWAAYVPAGESLRLTADSDMEAALVYAPGKPGLEPRIIAPDELVVLLRGKPGFERAGL